jgi:SAM-dependent methyltransferase
VIEAFGEAIPLAEAGFDLVVARQVLHHANNLGAFCNEMARLSRPGALILTLRDHVISGPAQLQPFLDNHPLHHLYGGENAFTLAAYRAGFTGAGLSILHEWRSFQSVLNFDPATPDQIIDLLAARFGALGGAVNATARLLPFGVVAHLLSLADRRPGRLVSYLARRSDH